MESSLQLQIIIYLYLKLLDLDDKLTWINQSLYYNLSAVWWRKWMENPVSDDIFTVLN